MFRYPPMAAFGLLLASAPRDPEDVLKEEGEGESEPNDRRVVVIRRSDEELRIDEKLRNLAARGRDVLSRLEENTELPEGVRRMRIAQAEDEIREEAKRLKAERDAAIFKRDPKRRARKEAADAKRLAREEKRRARAAKAQAPGAPEDEKR